MQVYPESAPNQGRPRLFSDENTTLALAVMEHFRLLREPKQSVLGGVLYTTTVNMTVYEYDCLNAALGHVERRLEGAGKKASGEDTQAGRFAEVGVDSDGD